MKWMLYLLLIAVTILAAPDKTDVGKLQPIEIVMVSKKDNVVIMETDTGDRGKGSGIEAALQDMKETSAGIVMLDTAEYLLIERGAEQYMKEISELMKGNVRVAYAEGTKDLELAGAYLNVHRPKLKLKHANGSNIEEILVFEENEKEKIKKMKIILDK